MANNTNDEPEMVGYLWSNTPKARENYFEYLKRITQKPYWRNDTKGLAIACEAQLIFDNRDERTKSARLIIETRGPGSETGIAYDGPFAEELVLFIPGQAAKEEYFGIFAWAFVDEERTHSTWGAKASYDFRCDERTLSVHLLNYNHMDYAGSTVVVLREDISL